MHILDHSPAPTVRYGSHVFMVWGVLLLWIVRGERILCDWKQHAVERYYDEASAYKWTVRLRVISPAGPLFCSEFQVLCL